MRLRVTIQRAALVLVVAAVAIPPGWGFAAYSWTNVTPPPGIPSNGGTSVLDASISWGESDTPLNDGVVEVTVPGYSGMITKNIAYYKTNGGSPGVFKSDDNVDEDGSVTFSPALANGTNVTVTFKASATVPSNDPPNPPTTVITTTTSTWPVQN